MAAPLVAERSPHPAIVVAISKAASKILSGVAFGLVLTILLTLEASRAAVAASVGLYITAAYWFTASTSFANPAVTIARSASNTFAGIRPADVAPFVAAQLLGAAAAVLICQWMLAQPTSSRSASRTPAE